MSNQFNEMEYSSVYGVMQDINMPYAGLEQSMQGINMPYAGSEQPMQDGPFLYAGREGRRFQSSRINIAPSEGHVDHARVSPSSEDSFVKLYRYLATVGNEIHDVHRVLRSLEDKGVTSHLNVANQSLKLDANKPPLESRSFQDLEGDKVMVLSSEHKKVLSLLSDAHDFLSLDESCVMVIRSRGYNDALRRLHLAEDLVEDLVSRWLSQ